MENKREILTHDHKYWRALITRLYDALGKPQDRVCRIDLRHTRKILNSLPQIDVEGTVEYLQSHGGYCDCEVLMNVVVYDEK